MGIRKNEIKINLDKDILQMVDYYSMATGTDRAQVCKIAILDYFMKGTPAASANEIFEQLDFSTLESFIKSVESMG